MKNFVKHYVIMLFLVALTVVAFAVSVSAATTTGTIATGLTWSLDDDTGVMTVSGDATTWPDNWNANGKVANTPWPNDYWKVKELEINAPITKLGAYGVAYLTNCTKITVPSTLTTLASWGAFYRCDKLTTVAVKDLSTGNVTETEGVIDLRGISTYATASNTVSNSFIGACKSVTPTIYLSDSIDATSFASCCAGSASVTFYTKAGTSAETAVNATILTAGTSGVASAISIAYYPTEPDTEDTDTYSYGNITTGLDYAYNTNTKVMTIYGTATTLTYANKWEAGKGTGLANVQKTPWGRDGIYWEIKEVVILAPLTSVDVYGFAHLKACTKITIPSTVTFLGSYGVFYNDQVLNTITVKNFTEVPGESENYDHRYKDANGVSHEVAVSETISKRNDVIDLSQITSIGTDTFNMAFLGSTPSIYLNDNITPTSFSYCGSTSCQKITFYVHKGTAADIAVSNVNMANSAKVIDVQYIVEPSSAISMLGYQVRTRSYNGLRGIFEFDEKVKDKNIANGFSLIEYGAIITSETNKNTYGTALTYDTTTGEYQTANAKVIKYPIYSDTGIVGKILEGSVVGDKIRYCTAVVNYPIATRPETVRNDLYMSAYSIWIDADGEYYVFYADSENDEYDTTNLYEVSLNMLERGLISTTITDEDAVWNVLKTGALDGHTEAPLGEGSEVKYTLLDDLANGYVAVIRGNGETPIQSDPAYNDVTGVKFVVVDSGITKINRGIVTIDTKTVMYPTTLTEITDNGLHCTIGTSASNRIATVFMAGTTAETGLWDLSHITTISYKGTIQRNNAVKIHLPANTDNTVYSWMFSTIGNQCKGVWFGDGSYTEGTIDLTGMAYTTIESGAFAWLSTGTTTVILPDGITTVADNAFKNSTVNVRTSVKNQTLADVLATVETATYTDLTGENDFFQQ